MGLCFARNYSKHESQAHNKWGSPHGFGGALCRDNAKMGSKGYRWLNKMKYLHVTSWNPYCTRFSWDYYIAQVTATNQFNPISLTTPSLSPTCQKLSRQGPGVRILKGKVGRTIQHDIMVFIQDGLWKKRCEVRFFKFPL